MGVSGHFVAILRILKPPKQLSRPDLFPGQHLPHHPVDLRPRDPGHLFPPSLLQAQQEGLCQQAQGHMVCQPAQVRVSYSSRPTSLFSVSNSVSLRHLDPPTYARVSNGVSSGALDR